LAVKLIDFFSWFHLKIGGMHGEGALPVLVKVQVSELGTTLWVLFPAWRFWYYRHLLAFPVWDVCPRVAFRMLFLFSLISFTGLVDDRRMCCFFRIDTQSLVHCRIPCIFGSLSAGATPSKTMEAIC